MPRSDQLSGPSHLILHHGAESEGFTYEVEGGLLRRPALERPRGETGLKHKAAGAPRLHARRWATACYLHRAQGKLSKS